MNSQTNNLLICDLDNTLYDWVAYFVPSLAAMVEVGAQIMKVDSPELMSDLKAVHQRYHNSEHPFALLETKSYLRWSETDKGNARKNIDPAFHAFNSTRKSTLQLYPGVRETLKDLRSQNVKIVGYSDSGYFGVLDRLRRLKLIEYFDKVYCIPRFDEAPDTLQKTEGWNEPILVELRGAKKKPNQDVLKLILDKFHVAPGQAVYVGDSLAKDVWMANQIGIPTVWAKYGTRIKLEQYDWLARVSHWTDKDIAFERNVSKMAEKAKPDFVCEWSFAEIETFIEERWSLTGLNDYSS